MKKQNGITLITLIITIIIMLILVGVALSMALGDGSIIEQAETAGNETRIADIKERLEIAALYNQTLKYNGGKEKAKSDVVNELLESGTITQEEADSLLNGSNTLVVGDTEIDFSIFKDDTIENDENGIVICNDVEYASLADAIAAIVAGENSGIIMLLGNIKISETLAITKNIKINGDGYTIARDNADCSMFKVETGSTLTFENVHLDGGAIWSGSTNATLLRGTENTGIATSYAIIETAGTGSIILNQGAVVENNDGAIAISLATRGGGTLTLNGAQIINNASSNGALWAGGHIIINENSKINGNYATDAAGAIRMVGSCNLTMNGGEICNNFSAGDGGAIWGYGSNGSSSIYSLNGGKIANNTAIGNGGAIYTGNYSTINLSGNFEICNNTAADSGGIRLTSGTNFNMTGGKIYGNTSTSDDQHNGVYGWNPYVTITGGELTDNIGIGGNTPLTIGGNGITGTIYFEASNTVKLASGFGTIKFKVAEGADFSAVNLKPADGYTYTVGDEAKLICLNEGYTVVWDASSSTFKLQ